MVVWFGFGLRFVYFNLCVPMSHIWVLELLTLELQVVVSYLAWELNLGSLKEQ